MPYGMSWDEFKPDGYSGSGGRGQTYQYVRCATEVCNEKATHYFEVGGIGGHYCRSCARVIQSFLKRTPTTQGDR